MADLLPALAERLKSIHLQNEGLSLVIYPGRYSYEALAREALAVVAERLPTGEEIAALLPKVSVYVAAHERWELLPDVTTAIRLLRDLRGRLGVET